MSQTQAMVNKLLTNVSNGLFPKGYIAESALPMLSVKQKSGIIGAYGSNHLRAVDDLIGGQAEARRVTPIDRSLSNVYSIFSHALEGLVTQDDYDNVEEPFDAEADETLGLTSLILTNKERSLASTLFSTSVITQTSTPSTKYDVYASSDPLADFKTARNTILNNSGVSPNAAIMSRLVYNALSYHPAILDVLGFKYNQVGLLSEGDIKKALGVEELLIADAPYNAAKEGQAESIQQIWGDSILFYVKPASPSKYQMSLGYYLKMSSRKTRAVYKYAKDNPPNSNAIIVQDDYSFKMVNTKCGYLLNDVLT